MKTKLFTLLGILGLSASTYAQDLYVANNSYVFVTDEVLFVNDDIRLDTNTSNIYLRNLAQLVQNTDTKNSDEGDLSVIQDQTTGIFEYNNWASPVGLSDTSNNTNTNFGADLLYYDTGLVTSTQYTANAPAVTFINGTATEIATYWLFSMIRGNGYTDWNQIGNTSNVLGAGYGFTMKGNGGAGNDYDFRGRPNTGNISIDVDNSGPMGYSETLTGNPYPSALDLKLFLIDAANTALDGNIYFWQQQAVGSHFLEAYQGGYATYAPGNPADLTDNGSYTVATFIDYDEFGFPLLGTYGTSTVYTPAETRYAAIGQGYMVRGDAFGTATYTNAMRVYQREGAGSSVFRIADNIPNNDNRSFTGLEGNNTDDLENNAPAIPMSHNGIDYENIVMNPTIVPEIRIHTRVNDSYYRESVLAFRDSATPGYDKFMDGNISLLLDADAYFVAGDRDLAIQSITYDIDEKVPFGFIVDENAQTSNFKVTANRLDNVDESINIYVHDKQLNTYTDIKNGTFEINLDPGNYTERFDIVFRNAQQDQIDDIIEDVVDTFDIFQDNNGAALIIKNPELVDIKSVGLYDVTGKQVYNKVNLQTQDFYSFPSNNLSDGIYIVKLITANNVEIGKKVSVSNRK